MDAALLPLLACPVCKGPLTPSPDASTLACPSCRRDYPIRDGIPDLVP